DRRPGVHVHRSAAALRPSACLPRHGWRIRDRLPLLLDSLPARSQARSARGPSGRERLARGRGHLNPPRRRFRVSRTILIAGGGIGGLVTALALARKGFRAAIFEQSLKLEPIGAGIQLSPNAMHVLQGLGLLEALEPCVISPE